jgi:hypothetical protein
VKRIFEWVARDGCSIGEVCRRLKRENVHTRTGKSHWDRTTIWGMASGRLTSKSSTVWWSTPAAPLFASTLSLASNRLSGVNTLSLSVCHRPPGTPPWRAVNMRSVHTHRFAQSATVGGDPAGVAANGTVAGLDSLRAVISHPLSCVAFAPRALPRFIATMHALTPTQRLFVHALPVEPGLRHMNSVLSV